MADPYAPATGNTFYTDFSGTGSRQQFPWEDLTSGMTQDQYWNYIGSLAAIRPTGFDQGPLPVVSDANINPFTEGYNAVTGFNYTNQYGGPDNIFTPQNVPNVGAELNYSNQLLAEQQAAQAAAAANRPSIGSQVGYGLLGMATGIPGGIIRAGVNALGNMGGETVAEGGMLPAFYTTGAPTGFVDAQGFPINPDTGLRYDASMVGGGGVGSVTASAATTPRASSTASTTTTGTTTETDDTVKLDPFQVRAGQNPTASFSGVSSTALGGANTSGAGTNVGSGTVNLPSMTVSATNLSQPTGSLAPWLLQQSGYAYDPATGKYYMPPVQVRPSTGTTTTSTLNTNTGLYSLSDLGKMAPATGVGPYAAKTSTPSTTTSSSSNTSTASGAGTADLNLGSLVGTATNLGTGSAARNFPAELAASTAALKAQQGNLMGMYGGIYQNLLGQTAIPQAAQSSLQQMALDQAKLQRIQSGELSSEDIRNSQQAAREAYGARGQVMAPGAIGAEILNREAIRQQRENEARAGYQSSMGNVLNAAQLQTGNIFSPIGQLVSGTFNPLGAYPQDVYSTNVNAQLARDISAANNAAAIEAAKYGATAQKNAALTSAGTSLLGKLLFG